jgi:hypothetical protein
VHWIEYASSSATTKLENSSAATTPIKRFIVNPLVCQK